MTNRVRSRALGNNMPTIKTRAGTEVPLDGDLLAVLEALCRTLNERHGLDYSFEDTLGEIHSLVDQMADEEREAYLVESLLPQLRHVQKRETRRLHAQNHRRVSAVGVPELPRRPLCMFLAVVDPRHALRRPCRLRLRGPLRAPYPG